MKLTEIFQALALGELNSISLGSSGSINEKDYPKLIGHINLALTALYTRFTLNSKEVKVQKTEGVDRYKLIPDMPYIMDVDFKGDIISITEIFDENGDTIYVNDGTRDDAFLPAYNEIQLPLNLVGEYVVITYKANHETIAVNVSEADIVLPEILREALLSYVASRVFSGMNTESSNRTSGYYWNKYNRLCDEIKVKDLFLESSPEVSNKLEMNGWV